MSDVAFEKPVEDSVTKINDEVAVGEDLEFQRRWWKFEKATWIVFSLLLLLTLLGAFGRGPLSHARAHSPALDVRYERVERTGTPAMLEVDFAPEIVQTGKLHLFISQSMVKELGAQRVIPAPETSALGNGGVTYTFPATIPPATVMIELQPSGPGVFRFQIADPDTSTAPIERRVVVMP